MPGGGYARTRCACGRTEARRRGSKSGPSTSVVVVVVVVVVAVDDTTVAVALVCGAGGGAGCICTFVSPLLSIAAVVQNRPTVVCRSLFLSLLLLFRPRSRSFAVADEYSRGDRPRVTT